MRFPWTIPRNFMECLSRQIRCHETPWNFVIANQKDIGFPWTPMELIYKSMEHRSRQIKYHSSMEFHGTRMASFQMTQGSMEFNGTIIMLIKYYRILWNFMELWDCHFNWHRVPFDFHWILHGIHWNPWVAISNITEFHGIQWNQGIAISDDTRVPCNSMEIQASSKRFHEIPWNCKILIFHELGCVFCSLLHDFMWLHIGQSISGWNIDISQF